MAAAARVGLVTPNLNYGRLLARTLESVASQDALGLVDHVVVDGGSTDESPSVLRSAEASGLRWLSLPGVDQYASINRGFALVSGDIMGWLNSDDVLFPWTIRTVVGIFDAFPDIDWIVGAPALIQADAVQEVGAVRPYARTALRLGLYAGATFGIVQQESCFWRRRLWDRAGPLREDLGLAADFELWIRFARETELAACTALLGGFSLHGRNRSRIQADAYARDVDRVVNDFPAEEARERRRWLLWHSRYWRARPWPGLKRMVRELGRLVDITGPVVRRDFGTQSFRLVREPLYP